MVEIGFIGTMGIMVAGWFLIQKILIPGIPRIYKGIKGKIEGK